MGRYTLYKYISRLMAVLMVLALVVGAVPAAMADGESGTMGDNLSWSLSAGTLTITGSGAMADISELERAPWHELRNEIYQVVLPEGLTSIGDMAFYECGKLQSVVIPSSVTRIGSFAFAYCADLKVLNLGTGVTAIEECAFTDCYDLVSLQLPGSLKTIGKKAFYRCESIPAVAVPSSVTDLGIAAFGYCKSLISADVRANITELPTLLFYGCARLASVKLPDSVKTMGYHTFLDCEILNTVYYNGTSQTPEQIQQAIGQDVPGFTEEGTVTEGTPAGSVTSGTVKDGEDGTIIYDSTTVDQGQDVTVTTQVQHTENPTSQQGSTVTNITVTITGESGWDEAADAVEDALKSAEDIAANTGATTTPPHITIFVNDSNEIDEEFVDNLAGRDVIVTVITQDGSQWQFKGMELDGESESESYDLRYEVSPGSAELCEELGTDRCFVLKFLAPATINAEVMIRLDPALSLQNGTLLQRDKKLTKIQSSVIDYEGYAHFYLASVSNEIEYYIAMNLPEAQQEAIIPEAVQAAYGNPEYVEPIKYEITGRTSSWGMGIGQVTWILVAVMVGSIVVVGAVIFLLNKRKLKRGYVPSFEDDE